MMSLLNSAKKKKRTGPGICSKSEAIFAPHLALSWGRDMSPPVITKMDATGSQSRSYSTDTHTQKKTTTVYSGAKDVSDDSTLCEEGTEDNAVRRGRKCPLLTRLSSQLCWNFMHQISSQGLEITNYPLQKLWPLPFRWETTLQAAEREASAHVDNNHKV